MRLDHLTGSTGVLPFGLAVEIARSDGGDVQKRR